LSNKDVTVGHMANLKGKPSAGNGGDGIRDGPKSLFQNDSFVAHGLLA
jgi:hypothetical protein